MLQLLTGEASKVYKKKNVIKKGQKLWINMH